MAGATDVTMQSIETAAQSCHQYCSIAAAAAAAAAAADTQYTTYDH